MSALSRILGADGQPFESNGRAGGLSSPEYGENFPIPHIATFAQVVSGGERQYFHARWDEAIRKSRENGLIMKRDAFLLALLQERKLGSASLPWEISVPNEKDPRQVIVRDTLRYALENTRDLRRIIYALLEAIWYGRYGAAINWKWSSIQGQRVLSVADWYPINGDKIGWNFSGVPYILVNAGLAKDQPDLKLVNTSAGGRGLLLDGTWREHFIIHRQEADDADFFDGEQAARVWGVGVRDKIFWLDFIRREMMEWMFAFLERVGLGVTIWYYEGSNPQALKEVQYAAKYQSRRANLFVPVFTDGKGLAKGLVERIETPVNGVDALRMLKQDFEQKEERMIIGQEASSKSDGVSGLGNQSGASFQKETKRAIITWDARILEETLTGDEREPGLVYLMQKYSFPDTLPHLPGGFRAKFQFAIERDEADKKLAAIEKCVAWGLPVKADEVRAAAGLSKPDVGDEVIQGQVGQPMPGDEQQPGSQPGDLDALMGPDAEKFPGDLEAP